MNDEKLKEEVRKACEILKNGGIILYPTDTIWGIGCDATNEAAVKRVYELKHREDSKAMLVLLDDVGKLASYVEVPDVAYELLEVNDKPMTIIYPNAKNLAKNLIAQDRTIGIRITSEIFTKSLLYRFRKPIVSTGLGCGEAVPAKVEDAVGLLREAVERQLVEPEDVPPVLRRVNFVIEDDEYILLRRGVVHLEVRKVVGFYLQLPEADHLVAGSDGFVPFGLADPLLRIDVQFGERGVSHRLGYAAVVRGGRHVLQQADVILDLLFDEREEELAIHLPGQARVREVGGEGNIAEQIHGIQIEPCAHDQHLGYQAGFGLEIDRRLVELIEYLVAERNAAEKELPDRLQILHLRIPRVCVHVAPYAVVDPLVSFAQGTDRLVRRYGNRAPDTAVAGIAYQISVNTPGAHQEFFFVVEEFVRRDRGVGILFQVGAGTQYCT